MTTFRQLLEQLKTFSDEQLDQPILLIPEDSDDALLANDLGQFYNASDVNAIVSKTGIYFCGSDFFREKLSHEEVSQLKDSHRKIGLVYSDEDYEQEEIHSPNKAYLLYKLTDKKISL